MLVSDPVPDTIQKLADAWDGRGAHCFTPLSDHLAILRVASLPETLARTPWVSLEPRARMRIALACRSTLELASLCAVVLK